MQIFAHAMVQKHSERILFLFNQCNKWAHIATCLRAHYKYYFYLRKEVCLIVSYGIMARLFVFYQEMFGSREFDCG